MNEGEGRIGVASQVYTKELISVLVEPLYDALMEIYVREANMTQKKMEIIIEFQKKLKDVPNWNQNNVDTLVEKCKTKCPYLTDLLSAVFFSNVKILSSVKITKSKKKVHVKLPDLDKFIHKTFIENCKAIYTELSKSPTLFSIKVHGTDMNNKEYVLPIINDNIEKSILKMLPFQNILQTYFGDYGQNESESESESESEPEDNHERVDDVSDHEQPTYEEKTEPFDENIQHNEHMQSQDENQNKGFFDNPNEIKEVSLNKDPHTNKIEVNDIESLANEEKQVPSFFPDARENPPENI